MRPIVFLVPLVALAACTAQPPPIAKVAPVFPTFDHWAPQEVATNVQDWDRVATKVADRLAIAGMLQVPVVPNDPPGDLPSFQARISPDSAGSDAPLRLNGHNVTINYDRHSMASRQVRNALLNEIINRGGPTGEVLADVGISVVPWQSRVDSQPTVLRREGIWQITVNVGGHITSFREPFYFMDSDAALYVQLPAPPLSPAEALAASARPLIYSTK